MNTPSFSSRVTEYRAYRRLLGYKTEPEKRTLLNLASFMDRHAPGEPLTDGWIMQWSDSRTSRSEKELSWVLRFSLWLALHDPRTTVSDIRLHHIKSPRPKPYIYEPEEIQALLSALASEKDYVNGRYRRHTYYTLLGLLVSTGLRISEAIFLDHDDVNLVDGLLRIRDSKSVPLRTVPLHESATKALQEYIAIRDAAHPCRTTPAFFLGVHGGRLHADTFRNIFYRLRAKAGLPWHAHHQKPRIHDFRHTFACRYLLGQYQSNKDLDCAVADLAVFLGHKDVNDTYWYLSAIPDLMGVCSERFRRHLDGHRQGGMK